MKKSRELMLGLIVSGVAVLLFLLVFELVLWILEPKALYERENEFNFYEYDDLLGWKNKPNAAGEFYIPDTVSNVSINSLSMRDEEIDIDSLKEKTVIQFYGDSFTWGYGVNRELRYTEIVEQELENRDKQVELLNFGTAGYGTDQQYLQLLRDGSQYPADVIVIAFHNDAEDISKTEIYSYPRPHFKYVDGNVTLTNVPVPTREVEWEERESVETKPLREFIEEIRVVDFIGKRLVAIPAIRSLVDKARGHTPQQYNETLLVLDHLFLQAEQVANKMNATLIIATIPDRRQVYGTTNTVQIDHVVEFGKQHNIPVINVLPQLRAIGETDPNIYFEIDGHFSEHGNNVYGELLAEELAPYVT